jgi:hypothetical protein
MRNFVSPQTPFIYIKLQMEIRNIIFSETGKIQYNRIDSFNILILLNFSFIEDDSLIYKTDAYFYVRKKWGRITIAHGFNADPDGAPTIP